MVDCLLVAVDVADAFELGTGDGEQVVIDLDPHAADDRELMAHHEVIHLIDGAGRRVLDGKNAIFAKTLVDGAEDSLKLLKIADSRVFEEPVCGMLGIGPFDALTGDEGGLGE